MASSRKQTFTFKATAKTVGGEEVDVVGGGEEVDVIGGGEEVDVIGGGEIVSVEEEEGPLCKAIFYLAILALLLGVVVETTATNMVGMQSTALLLVSVNLFLLYIIRCSGCRC